MVGYDDKSPTDEKGMAISSGRSMDGNDGEGETHMTKAKWLACFALGLSYTTSFQQGACLGSIVKSIDEALGEHLEDCSCQILMPLQVPKNTTTG